MASIRTAINLYDGMTSPLRSITKAIDLTVSSFQSMQTASGKMVDTSSIQAARAEIAKANVSFDQLQQEIDETKRKGENLPNAFGGFEGMLGKLKSAAAGLGVAFGASKMIGLADTMTSTTARLDLINDGLQSTAALQDKIAASANRSRASYQSTADVVSKLGVLAGQSFKNNDEMIAFSELMNKNFVIGGASAQEQTSAMYQLTQAMAAGKLQGDEFRSIMENAPLLAQSIAQYTGKSMGELKKMSSEGLITADIIKGAMFNSADEINARFEKMPMTFAQLGTLAGNILLQTFQPVIQVIGAGAQFIYDNWSIIAPLMAGIASAVGLYLIATYGAAAVTKIWTAVQAVFNAVMAMNPVVIVIMAIILLIAVVYAVVAAINKFQGTSISATGVIAGAFAWLGALIFNIVIGVINSMIQFLWTYFVEPWIGIIEFVLNVFNGGFNSFGDAVKNLLGNIISWFLSLGQVVTKIIDAIFGFNWTGGLESLKGNVLKWGKNEKAITLDREAPTIGKRIAYKDAYAAGYKFGENIGNKVGNAFGMDTKNPGFDFDNMKTNVADTAGNTAKMADSMEVTEESLEYMRDLAEQEAINRFTTAEVKVDFGGVTNQVSNNVDLDGVVEYIAVKTQEALEIAAEGVHA